MNMNQYKFRNKMNDTKILIFLLLLNEIILNDLSKIKNSKIMKVNYLIKNLINYLFNK